VVIDSMRPTLRQGSRVAIASPAGATRPELVEQGCEHLRAFGYEPVAMPHALSRGPLYYAGTAAERVADLHTAFADSTIDGILCTRGGWGSAELLPLLDASLIRANPKVFVGYSDNTSLHTWLWNECGLATFYAPMVAADWSKQDGVDERTWRATLHGEGAWSVGAGDGLRSLRDGTAHGRLLGGCLSLLVESLGTAWAFKIHEPCILFLEDSNTRPYQWDRMIQHLRFAGALKQVTGIVFGDMTANVSAEEMPLLEAACLHALGEFAGPVAIGLQCGHVERQNRSLPLGVRVIMEDEELSE
jgi:muramoyltetrapeptide carboxypeptidase